jgi:hypothetical protein
MPSAPFKPPFGLSGDGTRHFWQKRYYDFNVRDHRQFMEKLRYIHRNPVKRGLCERPEDWRGAAFATMPRASKDAWRLNRNRLPESASEPQRNSVRQWNFYPTEAKSRLESATRHLAPPDLRLVRDQISRMSLSGSRR